MRTMQWMAGTVWALVLAALGTAAVGAQTQRPGRPSESITVRGYWTIEVSNPDGTLAKRYEFENALAPFGRRNLVNFLSGASRAGKWAILVLNPLCAPDSLGDTQCFVIEPGATSPNPDFPVTGPNRFPNLTVTGDLNGLTLRGTFTAAVAGAVDFLHATLGTCAAADPPPCSVIDAVPFSAKLLTTAIPVQQGQIVQLTVNISFSSPTP